MVREIPRAGHGQAATRRRALGDCVTADSAATTSAQAPLWAEACRLPGCPERHPVRASDRDPVGVPASGTRLRLRDDMLAPASRLASRGCVGASASGPSRTPASGGPNRLEPRSSRLLSRSLGRRRGKKAAQVPWIAAALEASTTSSPTATASPWWCSSRPRTCPTSTSCVNWSMASHPYEAGADAPVSGPNACTLIVATTLIRTGWPCACVASCPSSRDETPSMAVGSASTAGSWSARDPGFTSSVDCASGLSAAQTFTRAFSTWLLRSFAGASSNDHSVRGSKKKTGQKKSAKR